MLILGKFCAIVFFISIICFSMHSYKTKSWSYQSVEATLAGILAYSLLTTGVSVIFFTFGYLLFIPIP